MPVLFRQSALNSLSSFLKNQHKEVLLGEQREKTLSCPFELNKCEVVFLFSADKGGLTWRKSERGHICPK